MTSESMMAELRRIIGAYMKKRELTVKVAAKEGAKSGRAAEKAAAYALGKTHGLGLVLDELCMTFDIDPWADEHERQMQASTGR